MKTIKYLLAIPIIAFGITSCSNNKAVPPNPDQVAYDKADGVEGARLYDHVLDYKELTDANLRDQSDFLRCKVCHGWDLKGDQGVAENQPGTATKPKAAPVQLVTDVRVNDDIRTIFDAVMHAGGRDPMTGVGDNSMPNYSNILSEADAWNLVKFIKETAHETEDFYHYGGLDANGGHIFSDIGKGGDAANGLTVYNANCKACHGADGTGINIYCKGEFLGDMFRNDPHEIQHKAVWGMPFDWSHSQAGCTDAGAMPAQNITDQDIRDLMAMGQDKTMFPGYEDYTDQEAYDAADGINGARLYDHVLDYKELTDATLRDQSDFLRCKVCHGWDLKGDQGVAENQPGTSTKPKAAPVQLVTDVRVNDDIRTIYDAIMNVGGRDPMTATPDNTMPDYSTMLTSSDAWDLVKFIKETAHETEDFYHYGGLDANGGHIFSDLGKGGDGVHGLAVYNANCKSCHGADGTGINIYCKGEYLGDMFRDDPHEIQHKAVWGMPYDWSHVDAGCTDAGMMPAQDISDQDIRDMMVMGQDAVAFPGFN